MRQAMDSADRGNACFMTEAPVTMHACKRSPSGDRARFRGDDRYELKRTSSQGVFFMPAMSIGEVAHRMGLRPSAIRYYERLGLIAKAPRVGGRRQYDEHVLERLAMVRFAKHVGFSV